LGVLQLPELKAQIEAMLARYAKMSRAFLLRELEHWNKLWMKTARNCQSRDLPLNFHPAAS
jgi:hypothetical protein